MTRVRPTVAGLLATRRQRQRTNIFIRTPDEARAAQAAGLDMLVIPDEDMSPAIREAAPSVFITAALAYGRLVTGEDYLREAFAMRGLGADAVYCAAGLRTVELLAAEAIPVVGHVGFIPTHATWTGGPRAMGKTAAGALEVWRQARRLSDAGAFGAEIELVPAEAAAAIAARSPLFLISMGSGAGCAAQYLFSIDILGAHDGHYPRHSKTYRNFLAEMERLQSERIAAYSEYRADVASGAYPGPEHSLLIAPGQLAEFVAAIDGAGDPRAEGR